MSVCVFARAWAISDRPIEALNYPSLLYNAMYAV